MPGSIKYAYAHFKSLPLIARIGSYFTLVYALYALLLGGIIPAVVEKQAPQLAKQWLGRELTIKQINVNPFLLRLRIDGFELKELDGESTFVGFERFDAQLGFWRSLTTLTPTLDHIHLNKPQVTVVHLADKSGFNFTSLVEYIAEQQTQVAEPEAKEVADEDAPLPAFRIFDIRLNDGEFHYIGEPTGAHLQYKGLNLALVDLDTQAATFNTQEGKESSSDVNEFHISLEGLDNDKLSLDGKFQFQPLQVSGRLVLDNIRLSNFWVFAEQQMSAKLNSGRLNFASDFSFDMTEHLPHFASDNGRFALSELEITDGKAPRIKLPEFLIKEIALDSRQRQVNIAAIVSKGLWIDAELNQQGVDLQQLFTPKVTTDSEQNAADSVNEQVAKQEDPEPQTNIDDEADKPWLVSLGEFDMQQTDIHLYEKMLTSGVHWRIHPLEIKTGKVVSDLSQPIDYQLSLALSSSLTAKPEKQQGKFSSQGKIDPKALTFDGALNLQQLALAQFQPYLTSYVNLQLLSGQFSTKGQYAADSKGRVNYSGAMNISELKIHDNMVNYPLVTWKNMAINSLKLDLAKSTLNIDTLSLDALDARVFIARNGQTNVSTITQVPTGVQPSSSSSASSAQSSNSKPMAININKVAFNNGKAYFSDYTLKPNFSSGIDSLNGQITHLSSTPGTKAQVDLKAKINQSAPMTVKGEINPLLQQPYVDLDLIFNGMDLTSVNPYAGTYIGHYIDRGQLGFNLNYHIENNHLLGINKVNIAQFEFGKASGSDKATNLPVPLAVTVLKDRHGVIDMDVKVEGDLDDPDFSFGNALFKAFANVITKAATAPLSIVGGLVGEDQQLDFIAFAAGEAEFAEGQQDKLDLIAQVLEERPILNITIVGAVDEKAEDIDDQQELQNLAEQRARMVKAYLVDEQDISPQRVFILDSKTTLITDVQGANLTLSTQ